MSRRFQREDEHVAPLSNTPGLNAFGQPQLGPYIIDFGEHGSESVVSVGQNFDFVFQNSSHEFDEVYMQDIHPTAALDNGWMSIGLPTSLESGLSATITSDTFVMNDVDLAELTILGSHTTAPTGNTITREQCIDYSTLVPHSALEVSPYSERDVLSTSNTDNIDMSANYNSYNIRQARKRPADRMIDETNDSLVDKTDALKIILGVLPEPSVDVIMYLNEQFGIRSDTTMNRCYQSVSSPEIRPFICDKPYRRDFDVSNIAKRDISVKFAEAEISPTVEIPNKRTNSKHEKLRVADSGTLSQRYPCTKCDRSFTRRHDALRHLKTHDSAQLYCPSTRCHKVFNRKDKLNDHIRRMHGIVDHESTMPQMRDEESQHDPDDRTSPGKRSSSCTYTLLLGPDNVTEMDFRDAYLEYIKQKIIRERDIDELLDHDASVILRRAYEAVDRYRTETSNVRAQVLLEKAAILYGTQRSMSRVIIFKKASATEATRLLRDSKLVNDGGQYRFSKIISIQLKGVMHSLMREMTEELMTGLEREIGFADKRQPSWARVFCIHVFLCVLTEDLQIAIDTLILVKLGTSLYDDSILDMILRLDDYHEDLQKMFHRTYGTNSLSLSGKELKGFNPIRDGLIDDIEKGGTQAEVDLINDIRGITLNNLDELEEKSANLSFKAEPNTLARHMAFRKRNSGRLVARFLRSLM